MPLRLVLCFTLVPMAELALLMKLGSLLGLWPTLALVLGTGFAGAWLARRQGLKVVARIQESLARGGIPADELLDGGLLLVAGIALVTPGLLTDLAGLALLVPWTRNRCKGLLRAQFASRTGKDHVVIDVTPR